MEQWRTSGTTTRRIFQIVRASVMLALTSAPLVTTAGAFVDVRIGYIGESDSDSWHGASQGVIEANAQGKFLGLRYELVSNFDPASTLPPELSVVIADVSPQRLLQLARTALGTPIINVSAEDDDLRAACLANLFHTIPSRAMRADAVQQWLSKNPQSLATAQAWHPTFTKYAAAQLNKRYSATASRPMTDVAWAAWAGVKLVSDAIARLGNAEQPRVMAALQHDLAFDGQKGVDMTFRDTGQLRQPLLLVEAGSIVAEAPVRGVVDTDDLDSLGLAECPK